MRTFLWQHQAHYYVTGKMDSEYLLAEEHDSEPLLENLSIAEVRNLRAACDSIIKFDEIRAKHST